jgi:hypothetical protein
LKALIEVLLAFLDVIKSGAESSREPIYKFFISLSLLVVAGLALAGGIGMMLAALLLGLRQVMPVHFAVLITGATSLLLAGVLIWVGKSGSKK